MDVYEKMRAYRDEHYITLAKMSRRINVPECILVIAENGGVTHPNFVKRIQKGYKLTSDEAECLLPECRRPHGKNYDPDRYVQKPDPNKNDMLFPKKSVIDRYLAERLSKPEQCEWKRSY